MSGKTAAIIGATGMIGNYLLELLLQDNYFDTIRVIVRRPYPKSHPKIEVKLVDFNDAESLKLAVEGTSVVFSCIGTTQKKVKGDKELYRRIDYDIPVKTGRFSKEAGCETFVIVSAVGANSHSNSFYLKLKGETDEALEAIGFRSLHIMQPAMLMGDRKEYRLSEKIIIPVMKVLSKLFIGSLRKYRSIHGQTVAAAMLNAAKLNKEGMLRYEYDEICKTANSSGF